MFEKTTFSIQRWFGKRCGALSGSFWELLGLSWELFGASRSTKEGLQIRLGTLLGLVCSLLAAEDGLGSVVGLHLACFGCSRGPCKGCFGTRQTHFDHQNHPKMASESFFVLLSSLLLLLLLLLPLPLSLSLLFSSLRFSLSFRRRGGAYLLGGLGAVLGDLGAILGGPGAVFGESWGALRSSWVAPGAPLGDPKSIKKSVGKSIRNRAGSRRKKMAQTLRL